MAQSAQGPLAGLEELGKWRARPKKTKAVGAAGKTGTGCRQHAQPFRACVRKASESPMMVCTMAASLGSESTSRTKLWSILS